MSTPTVTPKGIDCAICAGCMGCGTCAFTPALIGSTTLISTTQLAEW